MKIALYQIDAFTDKVFGGNPAAVVPLSGWPADDILQKIAAENNLSETAFFAPEGSDFRLRWFTPATEVDLCGHATLAAAFVYFNYIDHSRSEIAFQSNSGLLKVSAKDELLTLDFPALPPETCDPPHPMVKALGTGPAEVYRNMDYLAVFEKQSQIESLKPDTQLLKQLDLRGLIVTAPGETTDFVSRFFAPNVGIEEDPVTGSAHCMLAPYWSKRLGKKQMTALQLSARGGFLICTDEGERIYISGKAAPYLVGEIDIDI